MLKLVLYIRISLQCNNDIVSHAIAKGLEVMFPQETLEKNAQFKELASIYLCQKRFKMFFFCIIIIISASIIINNPIYLLMLLLCLISDDININKCLGSVYFIYFIDPNT